MSVRTAQSTAQQRRGKEAKTIMSNAAGIIRIIRTLVVGVVSMAGAFALAAGPAQAAQTPLEFESVEAGAYNADGTQYTQAGGVPHRITAGFAVTTTLIPVNPLVTTRIANSLVRDIITDAPPGLIVDPTAVPRCAREYLGDANDDRFGTDNFCPVSSQIGVVEVHFSGPSTGQRSFYPLFNVEPRKGYAADFAFKIPQPTNDTSHIVGSVLTGSYRGRASAIAIPYLKAINRVRVHLWGNPSDPSHDPERGITCDRSAGGDVGECVHADGGIASSAANAAMLRIQPRCGGTGEITTITGRSWHVLDVWDTKDAISPPATGCSSVPFGAQASVAVDDPRPGVSAAAKIGLTVPYSEDPSQLSHAQIDDVTVELPDGMRVNPATAHGLAACTEAQFAETSEGPSACPDAAVVGSVVGESPALDHPVKGRLYLAEPYANRFGSLVALYLVVDDEESGVTVKVAGKVDLDAATGNVRATFANNPQLPVNRLEVTTSGGHRAALVTPDACGIHRADAAVTSWARHSVALPAQFELSGACARPGFAPGFQAGVVDPKAGGSSPFVLKVARQDRSEELRQIDSIHLPEGLLGRVKGVDLCSADRADAGTCGEGSRIGRVDAAVGSGPAPAWVPESGRAPTRVHLTGPYAGAPYGLSIVVPAQAGPFDLGRVVVRTPLHVDIRSARLSTEIAESRIYGRDGTLAQILPGGLPRILDGVVLNQREIRVVVDRKGFIVNPTNCSAQEIGARIHGYGGSSVAVGTPFRARGCAALPFKPKLALRLTGRKQVKTGRHPGVRAQVRQKGVGEAGIDRAVVRLPKSLALDPDNAQALCEFEDGTKPDLENHCAKGSIVGRARARTPLLNDDLVGNVYFVKNVRRSRSGNAIRTLPMLIVALRGEIAINLKGESSTTKGGKLVNTFANVPDAPITKFNLNIKGGKNGILAVTRTRKAKINVCASRQIAETDMRGQNGRTRDFNVRMKTPCTARQTKAAKKAAKRATKARKANR